MQDTRLVRRNLTPEHRGRHEVLARRFEEHPAVFDNLWLTDGTHFWLSDHAPKLMQRGSRGLQSVRQDVDAEQGSSVPHSETGTPWIAI